jgi:hypothetical protein
VAKDQQEEEKKAAEKKKDFKDEWEAMDESFPASAMSN